MFREELYCALNSRPKKQLTSLCGWNIVTLISAHSLSAVLFRDPHAKSRHPRQDEATGEALFPIRTTEPTGFLLEIGNNSEAVGLLQDALIKLGYLTLDQVGNFRRTFGLKTEGAVKTLQQHLNLSETGKFSDVEQKAIEDLLKGIGHGHLNTLIVKVIQDRLVALRMMAQQQVDTGYGTFGGQTETAVKKFQSSGFAENGCRSGRRAGLD